MDFLKPKRRKSQSDSTAAFCRFCQCCFLRVPFNLKADPLAHFAFRENLTGGHHPATSARSKQSILSRWNTPIGTYLKISSQHYGFVVGYLFTTNLG